MDLRLPVVLVVPLTLSYSFLEESGPDSIADDEGEGEDEDQGGDEDEDETADTGTADIGGLESNESGSDEPDRDGTAETGEAEPAEDPLDRDAFFIGLGDAVIPSVLVASAAFFRPGDAPLLDVPGIALTVPALGAMVGTLLGLLALLWLVAKGRAHAGLPLLNGGAIGGYLVGALIAGVALVDALGLGPYL